MLYLERSTARTGEELGCGCQGTQALLRNHHFLLYSPFPSLFSRAVVLNQGYVPLGIPPGLSLIYYFRYCRGSFFFLFFKLFPGFNSTPTTLVWANSASHFNMLLFFWGEKTLTNVLILGVLEGCLNQARGTMLKEGWEPLLRSLDICYYTALFKGNTGLLSFNPLSGGY